MNDAIDDILGLLKKLADEVEGVAVRTARLEQSVEMPSNIESSPMQVERKRLRRLRDEIDQLSVRVQRLNDRSY